MTGTPPRVERGAVVRLWLERQGLTRPRGDVALDRDAFVDHLESTGALQLDPINAVERAHYLTLWSRFGAYDRDAVDDWVYRDRVAYEYWGHEASILPISHLPLGKRRMRGFPNERWTSKSWWRHYRTSTASKRRVLKRLREEGPLESADFEARPEDGDQPGGAMPLAKEDRRTLKLLWHDGRAAIDERRHFRCAYDIADRVYPDTPVASTRELEDSWLLIGLSGNGIASERHLVSYMTAPALRAEARKRVIARNLKRKRIAEVRVKGRRGPFYALPEHLERLDRIEEPRGTTLLSPFDSLLWQRKRAAELLEFEYTNEIYTPAEKRRYGYYVLPILHDGRLVGRLDPKLHRERGVLEIRSLHLEPAFEATAGFVAGLRDALEDLATFVGAEDLELPADWLTTLG